MLILGNCLALDDTVILDVTSTRASSRHIDAEEISLLKQLGQDSPTSTSADIDLEAFHSLPVDDIQYKDVIITFIAG